MTVDYLRSCYEVDFRFFADSDVATRVRWYFTDKPPLPIPHGFGSHNWLGEGEDFGLGEVYGATRKWVNGRKVGSAPGSHYCGTERQWVEGIPLPPVPPVPCLADGTPLCCVVRATPGNPMFGQGGQSQGINRSSVQSHGGQRQGGRGQFQPLLAGGGQEQGYQGTFAEVGSGGQQQGGSGLFVSLDQGGQQQGGGGVYPILGRAGQQQGGEGLFGLLSSGGQRQGNQGLFAWTAAGVQGQGGSGLAVILSDGGAEQGESGDFAAVASGGQQQGGTGGSTDVAITGEVIAYASSSAPTGFLACDGSAVSRTTYAALFAIIGVQFGAGDGSTTFNLPDFRGRTIIGSGAGSGLTARVIGQTGGEETHSLSVAELATHHHGETVSGTVGGGTGIAPQINTSGTTNSYLNTQDTGIGTAHNNMQPWGCMEYYIKT